MLKKILFLSFVMFMSLMSSASADEPEDKPFISHVMVTPTPAGSTDGATVGSKIEQLTDPIYGEGLPSYMLKTDIPQLWLELPKHESGKTSAITTKWYSLDVLTGGSPTWVDTVEGGSTDDKKMTDFWFSPTDWFNKREGMGIHWQVDSEYQWIDIHGETVAFGSATNKFITPEPVSMVLFGLGAGVLGLVQLRRKKK